jgi:hypothetical protein
MHNRVKRIPPALKHGAYSAMNVLPGESRAAFEKLHRDLIAEYNPSGVLEEELVADMARLVWRKRNIETLHIAERAQSRCSAIRDEKLNTEFPIPMLGECDPAKREENMRAAEDQVRKELGDNYELVEPGEAATFAGLTKELVIIERLDALIDKYLKRLLYIRRLKSISAAPSSAPLQRIPGPPKAA